MKPSGCYLHQISVSDGGVPKRSVGEARVSIGGLSGDRQRSPQIHGGPDRAVCLFSWEVILALRTEGHPIDAGWTGENLTLAGVEWSSLELGDRIRVGEEVELELTSYTVPCRFNAQWFVKGDYGRISHKRHPGWSRLYARVLREGRVRTGDRVVVETRILKLL